MTLNRARKIAEMLLQFQTDFPVVDPKTYASFVTVSTMEVMCIIHTIPFLPHITVFFIVDTPIPKKVPMISSSSDAKGISHIDDKGGACHNFGFKKITNLATQSDPSDSASKDDIHIPSSTTSGRAAMCGTSDTESNLHDSKLANTAARAKRRDEEQTPIQSRGDTSTSCNLKHSENVSCVDVFSESQVSSNPKSLLKSTDKQSTFNKSEFCTRKFERRKSKKLSTLQRNSSDSEFSSAPTSRRRRRGFTNTKDAGVRSERKPKKTFLPVEGVSSSSDEENSNDDIQPMRRSNRRKYGSSSEDTDSECNISLQPRSTIFGLKIRRYKPDK